MEKIMKKQRGFTLTELIIVIVIIGILAGVLIPTLSSYINRARKSAAEQDAQSRYAEFVATVNDEDYVEFSTASYVVIGEKYVVFIVKGAVDSSKTLKVKEYNAQYEITSGHSGISTSKIVFSGTADPDLDEVELGAGFLVLETSSQTFSDPISIATLKA